MRMYGLLAAAFVLSSVPAVAQDRPAGFTPATWAQQSKIEALLTSVPDPSSARTHSHALSAEAHVAGTPAQQRTAEYVLRQMASWGLDTSRVSFRVWLPYPDSQLVELEGAAPRRFRLDEPALPDDPTTQSGIWPAMNGSSGEGDVTAPVVYVNYGLAEDYEALERLGVPVEGRVVIARYGRSFRGIKAREAEAHGAAGLILYSDPQDDGYFRGDVYPDGPMRGPDAVQRGSILNADGDPTTPGWSSVSGARRLPPDSLDVAHIPVIPLGYGNAARILGQLGGPSVPQPWQGALPFRYHVGDSATRVRVAVWLEPEERRWKTITNTFGRLRGTDWPDEIVIAGGHRDAWGPGAADNISGTVSLLEAARAMGTAARQGRRPRRTVIFATWDAEEWGLVGSTEWVESREDDLLQHLVAYLNQDMSAFGRRFGAAGTPSLYPFIREVTRAVRQPDDTMSVYQAWRDARQPGDSSDVTPGVMGGGSDFGGFYSHLGMPALEMGFGGPIGVYHAAYDTWTWMERFGDPGYLSHAAAGRLVAVAMSRLANADVEPFDYAVLGRRLADLAATSRRAADSLGWALPYDSLDAAITLLTDAGESLNRARLARLATAGVPRGLLARVNGTLRQVEPAMSRPEGLVGRPWRRNLLYASDRNNGYADIALPGIAEAQEDRDQARARDEVTDLARGVSRAAERVRAAIALLEPGR